MTTTQVNDTVVSLLEAKGYHPAVGRAFCLGLEKSGRFTEVRDIVCAVSRVKVFSPRTEADLLDPDRLTVATRRHLSRAGKAKFYTPFKMTRHEILLFMARFPEVEVVYRSAQQTNEHALFANSRYVATEILLGHVREFAAVHGGDPGNVVDLGGNEVYHSARGRFLHCDTPITDARDAARYLSRDVYGGSSSSARCSSKFQDCLHRADFAIGVHSSYGMDPEEIAAGMANRGMRAYFGYLTVPSNLEKLADGSYESDGTNVKVCKGVASFTFPHDSSAAYKHSVKQVSRYLRTRTTFTVRGRRYIYRILSMRGDSFFHVITAVENDERAQGPPLYVVPPQSKYYLRLPRLTKTELEVDSEPFDRMVLHAACARNFASYDVSSLYQYAKSLRMSITVNSIVLSRGFSSKPEDLVVMVIAAYGVAAAYKLESSRFFRDVTTQVDRRRDTGFLGSLYGIATGVARTVLGSLATVSGVKFLYEALDGLGDSLAEGLPYLEVSVTPYALPEVPTVDVQRSAVSRTVEPFGINKPGPTLALPGLPPDAGRVDREAGALAIASGHAGVAIVPVDGHRAAREAFLSFGLYEQGQYPPGRGFSPTPAGSRTSPTLLPVPRFLSWLVEHGASGTLQGYITVCDQALLDSVKEVRKGMKFGPQVVTKYMDRMYEVVGTGRYYVVRGVGSRCVVVAPFPGYKDRVRGKYILCYDYEITHECQTHFGYKDEVQRCLATAGLTLVNDSVQGDHPGGGSTPGYDTPVSRGKGKAVASEPTLVGSSRGDPRSEPVDSSSRVDAGDAGLFDEVESVSASSAHGPRAAYAESVTDSGSVRSAVRAYYGVPPPVPPSTSGGLTQEASPVADLPNLSGMLHGQNSVNELLFMNGVLRQGIISVCSTYFDLAQVVASGKVGARGTWHALAAAVPSQPTIVEARSDHLWDVMQSCRAEYGGVYWEGELMETADFLASVPEGTFTVTCDELEVYTVDGIERTIRKYIGVEHKAYAVLCDGVASAGKTYKIVNEATPDDYVVCETGAALEDLKAQLVARLPSMEDSCWTCDSALKHDRTVGRRVGTLWVDEALRLHGGKIVTLTRMLRPARIMAFGDSKQIGPSTFLEGYDFEYFDYDYDERTFNNVARTMLPCMAEALSGDDHYGQKVVTHNTLLYTPRVEMYDFAALLAAAAEYPDTMVLTYTRAMQKELAKSIPNVRTIGKVQGQRFDHVIIVRHAPTRLVLFYDRPQALVAVTRARKTVRYMTVTANDDSACAKLVVRASANFSSYTDHIAPGARGLPTT